MNHDFLEQFLKVLIDAHAIQMNNPYVLSFPEDSCSKLRELKLLDVTSSVRYDMNVSLSSTFGSYTVVVLTTDTWVPLI